MASKLLRFSYTLLLPLTAMLFAGCATLGTSSTLDALLSDDEKGLEAQYRTLNASYTANPTDPALSLQYAQALIDTQRYSEAFDLVVGIENERPDDPRILRIKADALCGMGRFEAAIDYYVELVERDINDAHAVRHAIILLMATGRGNAILAELSKDSRHDAAKLQPLREVLQASIDAAAKRGPSHRITHSEPVISHHITDAYDVSVDIGGVKARLRLVTTGQELVLSDAFVTRIKAQVGGSTLIKDLTPNAAAEAQEILIPALQVGNARLEQVRAVVAKDFDRGDSSSVDGLISADMFPGYSYRIDRKAEKIELYPPDQALPAAATHAVTQPFYRFGSLIVTDAGVINRARPREQSIKMMVSTGAFTSNYELLRALKDDYGNVDTTRQMGIVTGISYGRMVAMTMTSLRLAGVEWRQDLTTAMRMQTLDVFMPQGTLGKDLLEEYRITVDNTLNQITFELYPGPDYKNIGPLPDSSSPGKRASTTP